MTQMQYGHAWDTAKIGKGGYALLPPSAELRKTNNMAIGMDKMMAGSP